MGLLTKIDQINFTADECCSPGLHVMVFFSFTEIYTYQTIKFIFLFDTKVTIFGKIAITRTEVF